MQCTSVRLVREVEDVPPLRARVCARATLTVFRNARPRTRRLVKRFSHPPKSARRMVHTHEIGFYRTTEVTEDRQVPWGLVRFDSIWFDSKRPANSVRIEFEFDVSWPLSTCAVQSSAAPTRSVPFRSVPFRSIPFHSIPTLPAQSRAARRRRRARRPSRAGDRASGPSRSRRARCTRGATTTGHYGWV